MKNLLTLLFAFVFMLGMTTCGGSATQEDQGSEAIETSVEVIDETEASDEADMDEDEGSDEDNNEKDEDGDDDKN